MSRQRKESPADIYHVVARGTGRQLIFEDDEDRRHFLRLLQEVLEESGLELYAWCLMGNHVHLLMHGKIEEVSACMRQLLASYAQLFNRKTGRVGHLFQERFKSEPVDTDEYLVTVVCYIHANPAKAGIGTTAGYRWSSYREYLGNQGLCETAFVLDVFGGRELFVDKHTASEGEAGCLDIAEPRRPRASVSDEHAVELARNMIGCAPGNLKALTRQQRDTGIVKLKDAGFSVRQIERMTGIGRSTISRIR